MAHATDNQKAVGVVMIVLGALLLIGMVGIPFSTELVGVALIVVALLMWTGTLDGSRGMAVAVGVLGVVLILAPLPLIGPLIGMVGRILDLVVGIVLLVLGILKLTR